MAASPPKIQLAELAAKSKAEARLGTIVSGRYRLTEVLAMGGVGVVYKGEHVHMRKKVAIKLLHPDAADAPDLVARFQREAVAGAHIQHPNVAAATDFGELEDGSFFLVLEYVRGTTLRVVIGRGPLSPRRAVNIGKQLAAALAATHAIGIVHRDVTPRNIMLVEGDREVVKLIDFGLARLDAAGLAKADAIHHSDHDIRITGTGAVFGTIAYLAPEVARGMDLVDARADLYALGICLYEMLSGKHPFDTTDAVELFKRHALTRPPPIAERTPGVIVPPALEAIVFRLLEKSPDDRYPSAEAVIAALDADLEGTLTPSTPPPVTLGDTASPSLPPPRPSVPPPAASPRASVPPPAASRPSAPPPRPSVPPRPSAPPHPSFAPTAFPPTPFPIPAPPALPRISAPPPPPTASPLPAAPLSAPFASAPAASAWAPPPSTDERAMASGRVHLAPVDPAPLPAPPRGRRAIVGVALGMSALGALALAWFTQSGSPAAAGTGDAALSASALSASALSASTLSASALPAPRSSAATSAVAATASPTATAATAPTGVPDPETRAKFRAAIYAHDYLHATPWFLALAERDPEAFHDPVLAVAARDLAVVMASLPGPDTDAIYAALESRLGGDGVDVLYEIVRTRGGSKASSRALALLQKPEVLARAAPPLRVTYDYAQAACPDKLALLDRAVKDGDVRTMMAMELSAKTCFHQNKPLDDAIKVLRARLTARPAPR